MGVDSRNDEINESNVLEEFEVDGKPAQVVVVRSEDLDEETKRLLAVNLADENFKLLKIPHAQVRVGIRELILGVRDKVAGRGNFINGVLEKVGNVIYPDYARSEHIEGNKVRFDLLMKDKQLLGVKIDGKIVAVQGFSKIGDTPSGREVFELTKASTLNDPLYRKKGFNGLMVIRGG